MTKGQVVVATRNRKRPLLRFGIRTLMLLTLCIALFMWYRAYDPVVYHQSIADWDQTTLDRNQAYRHPDTIGVYYFDKNRDGRIDMRSEIRFTYYRFTRRSIVIQSLDKDRDGFFDFEEWKFALKNKLISSKEIHIAVPTIDE